MRPASAKTDGRDPVLTEFCVEDSNNVNLNFEKSELIFICLGGGNHFKHLNEIDLFPCIDPEDSKHKGTGGQLHVVHRKAKPASRGQGWPETGSAYPAQRGLEQLETGHGSDAGLIVSVSLS